MSPEQIVLLQARTMARMEQGMSALEAENAALRAEVERLTAESPDEPVSP